RFLNQMKRYFLNTNNVKNEIFSFNLLITKMTKEIFDTKEISKNTQNICINNTEKIKSFILEIEPLIGKFESFRSKTTILNELSSEIKQILKEIHDIANQTKLLSLNASIVAASAGEHGDGFAVVSQEIGELSYKSSQSVSTIQDTLATIIKTISFINTDTIATSSILKEQALKSSIFSKNLSSINEIIGKMSSSFESISERSSELSKKNDLMLSSIKYITDESKSNNYSLKSISKSTKQLSDTSEYFKIELKKINRYIKNIKNSYKVFKIKKEE
ncbi:Methyl-accepting chemotaxis protein, partial [Candidatus Arthromitus sp. SFB-3]